MEEMRQAASLQSAAEKEADSALAQLEDFIQGQEMLVRTNKYSNFNPCFTKFISGNMKHIYAFLCHFPT